MKTRRTLSILAVFILLASTSFSECGAYHEEDTPSPTVTPTPPISGPMHKSTLVSPDEFLSLLKQQGIPVSTVSSSDASIQFRDQRLTDIASLECSGTLFIFPNSEAATSEYIHKLTNNKDRDYLYQNENLILQLSHHFTKGQVARYKTIFHLLAMLPPQSAPAPKVHGASTTTVAPVKTTFSDGTYVVGSMIPKGEYMIVSDGDCCHVTLKEGKGDKETIYTGSFYKDVILTMKPTEVLTIVNGTAIPLSKKLPSTPLEDGMFKVGTGLKAGTYKVTLSSSNIIGMGTVQIMKDSRFSYDSILSSNTFTKPYKIHLKAGQYIRLNGASITPV